MTTDSGEQPLRDDTLDLLFSVVKDAPERQLSVLDSLENKIASIFAAASVVVGLAVSEGRGVDSGTGPLSLLIAAVTAYLAVAFCTFAGLRLVRFRRTLHADALWKFHWQDPPEWIKHALVADAAESYAYNKKVLQNKGFWVLAVMGFAALEVLLVGVALIWSRV
ncbi:MAG TPA: hypothetical protein VNM43_01215 [Dehalococcoidia bacterium]|nr:hypothetical protein [Dehalococcoidia bacterium]